MTYSITGSVTETGSLSNIPDGSAVGQSYSCPAGFCVLRIQIVASGSLIAPRVTFVPDNATEPFGVTPGDFQVIEPSGTVTNAVADTQTAIASLASQVAALASTVATSQTSVNKSLMCKKEKEWKSALHKEKLGPVNGTRTAVILAARIE